MKEIVDFLVQNSFIATFSDKEEISILKYYIPLSLLLGGFFAYRDYRAKRGKFAYRNK